jgi:hypothetical protein
MARAHRKHQHLTLETVSGVGNLSTRFLSEFERGKETAENRQGPEDSAYPGLGSRHPTAWAGDAGSPYRQDQ